MAKLLQWIGGAMAVLGFGNLIYTPWIAGGQDHLLGSLVFNMLLFVVPGCFIYGIGIAIAIQRQTFRISRPKIVSEPWNPADYRLRQLNSLKEKGLVSPEDYESYRKEILNEC